MKKRNRVLVVVIACSIIIGACHFLLHRKYSLNTLFPLNENDTYIYTHYEGDESGVVTLTVKDVKKIREGKEFNVFWRGQYNDRIQLFRVTSHGLCLLMNKHLVGQEPLRVIRKFDPCLLMVPFRFKKNIFRASLQSIYNYAGDLIDKERIEEDICFVGNEEVVVDAGIFNCVHFSIRHNYKDRTGRSKHMHTYNLWIASGVGIVKYIHTFVQFMYDRHVKRSDKTIDNRYDTSFAETLELRQATIGGEKIGL